MRMNTRRAVKAARRPTADQRRDGSSTNAMKDSSKPHHRSAPELEQPAAAVHREAPAVKPSWYHFQYSWLRRLSLKIQASPEAQLPEAGKEVDDAEQHAHACSGTP